jgi:hypothetical protein
VTSSAQALRDEYLAANPLVGLIKRTTSSREDLLKEFELMPDRAMRSTTKSSRKGCVLPRCAGRGVGQLLLRFGISVPSERFRANFEHYLAGLRKGARLGVE